MVWGFFGGDGGLGFFLSFVLVFLRQQEMYSGYAACEEPDQILSVM